MSEKTFDLHARREQWLKFVTRLNPGIDPRTIHLMDEIRWVAHALFRTGESSLDTAGLSYAKYRILMGLLYAEEADGREGLNPSQISERQGTSRNTISSLIRDLEADGLIKRHIDQQDRRKFNICLTNAGRTLVHNHANRHLTMIDGCFRTLTAVEQETLSQLLNKVGVSACGRMPLPE